MIIIKPEGVLFNDKFELHNSFLISNIEKNGHFRLENLTIYSPMSSDP